LSNLSENSDLSEFYRKTLDIIYAFIIGQSFLSLDPLLKSVRYIFEPHNMIDLGAVSFAYFVVIFGWIQHHKSIVHKPHVGKLGNARYGVDLIILFLTYYLLRLSRPNSEVAYGEVFLWVLPTIFFFYSVWDCLKYIEYYSIPKKRVSRSRIIITVVFGYAYIMMGYLYYADVSSLEINNQNFWSNKTIVDSWYIGVSFLMMLFYRYRKWDVVKDKPLHK